MCYSTCSQTPVENEAIVAELLRTGCLELVECPVPKIEATTKKDNIADQGETLETNESLLSHFQANFMQRRQSPCTRQDCQSSRV
jgi:16S rRNA C967 or C1407 C5-methylase (RsmB/RsmF family)